MGYAARYLNAVGQDCTVARNPDECSKVSMKRSTSAIRDFGARESHWEGLILSSAGLISGDIFTVDGIKYLVQSAVADPASGETYWHAVKTNATLVHKRLEEKADKDYNLIRSWKTINTDVPAFGEIITAELRQQDTGLLKDTRYYFQVPKYEGVSMISEMDCIVFVGNNYRVDAVNDIGMPGVVRIQLSQDVRA